MQKKLPIRLYKKTFLYKKEKTYEYEYDELCRILEKQLKSKIESEKAEKTEVTSINFSESDEGVTLKAVVRTSENIGYTDFLLINTGN